MSHDQRFPELEMQRLFDDAVERVLAGEPFDLIIEDAPVSLQTELAARLGVVQQTRARPDDPRAASAPERAEPGRVPGAGYGPAQRRPATAKRGARTSSGQVCNAAACNAAACNTTSPF